MTTTMTTDTGMRKVLTAALEIAEIAIGVGAGIVIVLYLGWVIGNVLGMMIG